MSSSAAALAPESKDADYNHHVRFFRDTAATLEMIKWEHSIFALPFALTAAMLAVGGWPSLWQTAWIIVCMVCARSAAMAFNRYADADMDAANPRTRPRAIPAGLLSKRFVGVFTLIFCAVFVLAAAHLNRLTLYLSPLALAIVLGYSYAKRFTRWSHLVLGFALGVAPAAAWIAVRGELDPRILIMTALVTFWVAGFDVLYACQDADFDKRSGLHSIPQSLGIPRALLLARGFHLLALVFLALLLIAFQLGGVAIAGAVVVAALLAYEHSLVRAHDLSRLNAAFFTMNGFIAVVFFIFTAADLLWRR